VKNWFAVYVNVRHEKKVVLKLQEYGIAAYTPVAKRLQQWSDRKKWIEFPMLSGYVFVNIDITSIEKEKTLTHPSVFGFIKFEGKEAIIQNNEIDVLKSIELTGYDVSQVTDNLKISDNVIITQGPLKGLKGCVVRIQDEEYVSIELLSIKQNVKVKVPKHIVQIQSLKVKI
jgi:transcription antitermination factor NusG